MTDKMKNSIPLLVTLDLEIAHDHDFKEQGQILERLGDDLYKNNIPLTVFATADAAKAFPNQVQKLRVLKNEIGVHGITHSRDEDFTRMSFEKASDIIRKTADAIESVAGIKPKCFRGPFMSTSADTQKALIENGFIADFSVCSQRIDLFNATVYQLGWLTAPRRPYSPSDLSPYKKGKSQLMVIPASCLGLPFFSGVLYLFGISFMKIFYKILLKEARWFSKPVVFMFHSYEFAACRKGGGQKILHRLFMQNREKRYQNNLVMLKYMSAMENVKPMTGSEYVNICHDVVV
jgi:hypothetical protein